MVVLRRSPARASTVALKIPRYSRIFNTFFQGIAIAGQKKSPLGAVWVAPAELKEANALARSAQTTATARPPRRKEQLRSCCSLHYASTITMAPYMNLTNGAPMREKSHPDCCVKINNKGMNKIWSGQPPHSGLGAHAWDTQKNSARGDSPSRSLMEPDRTSLQQRCRDRGPPRRKKPEATAHRAARWCNYAAARPSPFSSRRLRRTYCLSRACSIARLEMRDRRCGKLWRRHLIPTCAY